MPAAPIDCPGCRQPMERLALERKAVGSVEVDLCRGCRGIWFDAHESLQLSPAAVLALFRAMHAGDDPPVRPLPERLPCPRCLAPLARTEDVQRRTRFAYWRCARGHGRFTPFVQFLREKDFVKPLGDAELARLRSAVRTIRCSGCGAPVDLERSTACGYCRSPIVALDPGALGQRAGELARAAAAPSPDPAALVDAMIALERERHAGASPGPWTVDLVELGMGALLRMFEPR